MNFVLLIKICLLEYLEYLIDLLKIYYNNKQKHSVNEQILPNPRTDSYHQCA